MAEAPPSTPERYFYYPDVKEQDALWIGLMKAIYGEQFGEVMLERYRKIDWLKRFQSDGYRLIDAVKEPIFSGGSSNVQIIKSHLNDIVNEIQEINPDQILMIKVTVYDALYYGLKNRGLPVVNARLPFPGSGRQADFHRMFANLVESGKITLTHSSQ